jgi:hypothetical protein
MSYRLADGSWSTDYKIGDKFTHRGGGLATLAEDDGSSNPWFNTDFGSHYPRHWFSLTPVKTKKPTDLINQLRETIKQLEATIQELER